MVIEFIRKLKRRLRYFFDVHIRNDQRIKAYHEYCAANDREKLLVSYPLSKDSVVFDVGGYIGNYAAEMYCKFGCRVVIFEPVREFAEIVEERFKFNSDITVVSAGLGSSSKDILIGKSHDASSGFGDKGELEQIQIIPLIEYMNENHHDYIDLIKIDIEGGKYELLDAMFTSSGVASWFNHILIQFHNFVLDANNMRASVRERMSITHELMWDLPFVWESGERKQK